MAERTFGDIDVPNAGRVYDYVRGGHHNYEADREAAEYMINLLPSTRKWMRTLRLFLQEAARRLHNQGYDKFLDLGSGLPTTDHIHTVAPDAEIIYVDRDWVVVEYGSYLLEDVPNAHYIQADVRNIEDVLTDPLVAETFGDRKVAIGLNAVTCFLEDDKTAAIAQKLYDWAAPGSKLFCTFETKDPDKTTPAVEQYVGMFRQMGTTYHFTTVAEARGIMQPWQADENGYRPLSAWVGLEDQFTAADHEEVGLEFYGAILEKPE